MTPDYSIGDLAKTTDTKVETIRYYERIGLLPEPKRTAGNYRSPRGLSPSLPNYIWIESGAAHGILQAKPVAGRFADFDVGEQAKRGAAPISAAPGVGIVQAAVAGFG